MLLYGMHDREGAHMVPPGGWCVDVRALSENPPPTDYRQLRSDINWLTRLSWGFGATGNIPLPAHYEEFARRCASYVAASPGCSRWQIGSEPNHAQERPDNQPISPAQYAECYLECRAAIKAVQPHAEVLVAAVAPWNLQTGDWLTYWRMVMTTLGSQVDGYTLHAYSHGDDPALAFSDEKRNGWYWHLRVYRDLLGEIPPAQRHLPCYITECNQGDQGWTDRNSGYVQALYAEIDRHNQTPGTQKIHCLCLYRWPRYDQWHIEGKGQVIADFQAAVQQGYTVPAVTISQPATTTVHVPVVTIAPSTSSGQAPSPTLPLDWDSRLTERGVELRRAKAQPGQWVWRVVKARWLDENESQGRHHIYLDALDEQGRRAIGMGYAVSWPGGSHLIFTEAKPGEPYAANFPMTASRNEFQIQPAGTSQADIVTGIGMGAETPGGFNAGIHTSTVVVYQKVQEPAQVQPQPPVTQPVNRGPEGTPPLLHPIADPALRVISQGFGENAQDYARWGLPGHNGVDFGVPEYTPILAADEGEVIESANDADGYGIYLKLRHSNGSETLYAHLNERSVTVGDRVRRGNLIAVSGNTGNSTGPHLHFGYRPNWTVRGKDDPTGYDGYVDPLPFVTGAALPPPSTANPDLVALLPLIKAAASEAGIDWTLLVSLVLAESSFKTLAQSSAGAMGLCQIMPATWAEWGPRVGATDPWNPADNLKVGAHYLAWLIDQLDNELRALYGYNWGVGNMATGREPPLETKLYAFKVLHGADLAQWLER